MRIKGKKQRSILISVFCDRYIITVTLLISLAFSIVLAVLIFISDKEYFLGLPWYFWLGLFAFGIITSIFLYLLVFVLMKIMVIIPMERQEEIEKKLRKQTIFDKAFKIFDKYIEFVNTVSISFLIGFLSVICLLVQIFPTIKLPNFFLLMFVVLLWSVAIQLIRKKFFPKKIKEKILLPIALVLSVVLGTYFGIQDHDFGKGIFVAYAAFFSIYWVTGESFKSNKNKKSEKQWKQNLFLWYWHYCCYHVIHILSEMQKYSLRVECPTV